jgi:2-C-methyl-D-erythritol 2,4-cyclodiphosphate synthase
MDALLGALALGDIGKHFPDTDPQFKGISSMLLLKEVKKLLQEKGYRVNNADILVVAEHPKLAPFIEAMRENIADMLETETDRINIKATTTEGLGFTGTGEGMAAYAVVTICKNPAS